MISQFPQPTRTNDSLETAIGAALEQQQTPAIPADFASRVAAKAAKLPQRARRPKARYARAISILLSVLLVLSLFLVAPHAAPTFTSLAFDIELTATALLAALGYWLTRVPRESL